MAGAGRASVHEAAAGGCHATSEAPDRTTGGPGTRRTRELRGF